MYMLLLKNRIQDYLRFIIFIYEDPYFKNTVYIIIHLNIIIPQCVNTRNVKTLFLYTGCCSHHRKFVKCLPLLSLSLTDYIWCIVAVNRGETIPGITVRPHTRIVVPREIRIDGMYT